MSDKKTVLKKDIQCPYCNRLITVKHTKETVTKAVKADVFEEFEVSKSEQQQLDPEKEEK